MGIHVVKEFFQILREICKPSRPFQKKVQQMSNATTSPSSCWYLLIRRLDVGCKKFYIRSGQLFFLVRKASRHRIFFLLNVTALLPPPGQSLMMLLSYLVLFAVATTKVYSQIANATLPACAVSYYYSGFPSNAATNSDTELMRAYCAVEYWLSNH
jgi:hypothetical protein